MQLFAYSCIYTNLIIVHERDGVNTIANSHFFHAQILLVVELATKGDLRKILLSLRPK